MTLEEIISELDQISDSLTICAAKEPIGRRPQRRSFCPADQPQSADFLIFWKWPSQRTFFEHGLCASRPSAESSKQMCGNYLLC